MSQISEQVRRAQVCLQILHTGRESPSRYFCGLAYGALERREITEEECAMFRNWIHGMLDSRFEPGSYRHSESRRRSYFAAKSRRWYILLYSCRFGYNP
jgi:hypothetical protein